MGDSQWRAKELIEENKMRDIAELNVNEGGRPVSRGAPSQSAVDEFQKEFRVSLPSEYVEFLAVANGGHPEFDSFVPFNGDSDNRFSVDSFYHLTDDERSNATDLWWATSKWQDTLGVSCVPIARDGGGNQIFIDCEKDNAVFLCLHDEGIKMVRVADSFSAFLDLLGEDPDMI